MYIHIRNQETLHIHTLATYTFEIYTLETLETKKLKTLVCFFFYVIYNKLLLNHSWSCVL